jgi:hypothetical protein
MFIKVIFEGKHILLNAHILLKINEGLRFIFILRKSLDISIITKFRKAYSLILSLMDPIAKKLKARIENL